MHLAVDAADFAIAADDDRGVVVEPRSAPLKQGNLDGDFQLAGQGAEACRARSRNRLGQVEQRGVLALAEILGQKQLWQADDLRAQPRRLAHVGHRPLQVVLRLRRTVHLYQAYLEFVGRHLLLQLSIRVIA